MFKRKTYLYGLATDSYHGFVPAVIKVFLSIFALIYGWIVRILSFFQHLKPYCLNCKVISVGNITLGGTGKTSLVEYIARYLRQQGYRVAVLSRGYRRKITNYPLPLTPESMGDEPYMLSQKLGDVPVIVDKDRIRAAKKAIKDYGADTVILDDGFQQWRIIKDLEIVCIDSTNPFGNRKLIPRGILREPLSSLKRTDVIILTKTNLNPDIGKIKVLLNSLNPQAQIFESIHKPLGFYDIGDKDKLFDTDELKGKTVTLISGIADPDSFENLIINLGIKVSLSFRFPDHHHYTDDELEKIIKESQEKKIDTIITTEKDAVRLLQLSVVSCQLSVLVLRIELKFKNEPEFHRRLLGLYPA